MRFRKSNFLKIPVIIILTISGRSLGLAQDSTLIRVMELEQKVKEHEEILTKDQQEEEIRKLLEKAEKLSVQEQELGIDVSKKYFSGTRRQQGLNPNISFGVDFFAAKSTIPDASVSEPGVISYGNNGLYLREAQLSLIAPLDPFSRGKGFLSATPEGLSVDEAYLEWLNLPLNINLKAGYFKPEFGFFNRYHTHALPQYDRPRALVYLFENEGLTGSGIATSIMLPALVAHASNLDISMIYGRSPQSFRSDSSRGVIFTGQWLNYFDLTASSYLEFRLSGAAARNDYPGSIHNTYVGSAGLAYKWAPVGREKYRTLEWKSEFLFRH